MLKGACTHPSLPLPRPECKLFVGYSKCCQGSGILAAGAAIKAWLVCNRDIYLPDAKCLTGWWLCGECAWCAGSRGAAAGERAGELASPSRHLLRPS